MRQTLRFLSLAVLALSTSVTVASAAANADISWSTVSSGGGHSTGSTYSLKGSIGQVVVDASTGGNYSVDSGYWSSTANSEDRDTDVYLPLIQR